MSFEYEIIGNGWTKKTGGGKKFLSIALKDGVSIEPGTPLFLFPNDNKREGKQDPDWTMSRKND